MKQGSSQGSSGLKGFFTGSLGYRFLKGFSDRGTHCCWVSYRTLKRLHRRVTRKPLRVLFEPIFPEKSIHYTEYKEYKDSM